MEKCPYCEKKCKTKAGLSSHIRLSHPEHYKVSKSENKRVDKLKEPTKFTEIDPVVQQLAHNRAEKARIEKENKAKLKYRT